MTLTRKSGRACQSPAQHRLDAAVPTGSVCRSYRAADSRSGSARQHHGLSRRAGKLRRQTGPHAARLHHRRLARLGQRRHVAEALLDLSRSFGELDGTTELFIDSYHVADRGNRLIAEALANRIDWGSIKP